MRYVKCVNNQLVLGLEEPDDGQESLFSLTIGHVYKVIPDRDADRSGMIRVFDESFGEPGSESGYLYPADYFEPFLPAENGIKSHPISVYVNDYLKGVLQAEAIAGDKSVSELVRDWVEERLDLPV